MAFFMRQMGPNKKMRGKCSFQHFVVFRLFLHTASSPASVLNILTYIYGIFIFLTSSKCLNELIGFMHCGKNTFLPKLRGITATSVLFQAFRCADGK